MVVKILKIAVVDGQGGGMGKAIIEKFRQIFGNELHIVAFGTNALATALMIKSGANEGASGENAIMFSISSFDVVIGSIAIIAANSMYGELTPGIATSIAQCNALKILIPLNKYNIQIAGVKSEPLPHHIDEAVDIFRKFLEENKNVWIKCIHD